MFETFLSFLKQNFLGVKMAIKIQFQNFIFNFFIFLLLHINTLNSFSSYKIYSIERAFLASQWNFISFAQLFITILVN